MEIYLKHRIVGTIVVFAIVATIAPAIYSSRDNLFPNQLKSNIPVVPDYRLGLPYLTTKAALLENSSNPAVENGVLVIPLDDVKIQDNDEVKKTPTEITELAVVKVAEADIKSEEKSDPKSAVSNAVTPDSIVSAPTDSNSVVVSKAVAPLVSPSAVTTDAAKAETLKQHPVQMLVATKPKPLAAELPIIKPAAIITATAQPVITSSEAQKPASGWIVQLGSFSKKTNATKLLNKLREHGHESFVEPITGKNGMVYRVRVGPESKQSAANSLKSRLFDEVQVQGIVMSYP